MIFWVVCANNDAFRAVDWRRTFDTMWLFLQAIGWVFLLEEQKSEQFARNSFAAPISKLGKLFYGFDIVCLLDWVTVNWSWSDDQLKGIWRSSTHPIISWSSDELQMMFRWCSVDRQLIVSWSSIDRQWIACWSWVHRQLILRWSSVDPQMISRWSSVDRQKLSEQKQ